MPLLVTMHTFSGAPDPQWVLDHNSETELRKLIADGHAASGSVSLDGGLGYRGFSVVETDANATPQPLFTATAAGAQATGHSIVGAPEIEHFLLWTGHDHVPDAVSTHVHQVLQAPAPLPAAAQLAPGCKPCVAKDAPPYTPAFWNTPARQPYNNCYNYANNQATNTFAQPGRATGHPVTGLSCPGVRPSAISDGLVPCPNFSAPRAVGHGWYVALVIWPGQDYHWYRQDAVGCWSHKPGSTAARNVDNGGHAIADPRTANRGPYTVFCTFMVTKRTVHIR